MRTVDPNDALPIFTGTAIFFKLDGTPSKVRYHFVCVVFNGRKNPPEFLCPFRYSVATSISDVLPWRHISFSLIAHRFSFASTLKCHRRTDDYFVIAPRLCADNLELG